MRICLLSVARGKVAQFDILQKNNVASPLKIVGFGRGAGSPPPPKEIRKKEYIEDFKKTFRYVPIKSKTLYTQFKH